MPKPELKHIIKTGQDQIDVDKPLMLTYLDEDTMTVVTVLSDPFEIMRAIFAHVDLRKHNAYVKALAAVIADMSDVEVGAQSEFYLNTIKLLWGAFAPLRVKLQEEDRIAKQRDKNRH